MSSGFCDVTLALPRISCRAARIASGLTPHTDSTSRASLLTLARAIKKCSVETYWSVIRLASASAADSMSCNVRSAVSEPPVTLGRRASSESRTDLNCPTCTPAFSRSGKTMPPFPLGPASEGESSTESRCNGVTSLCCIDAASFSDACRASAAFIVNRSIFMPGLSTRRPGPTPAARFSPYRRRSMLRHHYNVISRNKLCSIGRRAEGKSWPFHASLAAEKSVKTTFLFVTRHGPTNVRRGGPPPKDMGHPAGNASCGRSSAARPAAT